MTARHNGLTVVPILRSGVLAQQFCDRVAQATVEAVFARSLYLRAGDDFICIGEPDIGNGPLTLIGKLGLSDLDLRPGDAASVCDRHITIGNAVRFTLDRSEAVARAALAGLPAAGAADRDLHRPGTARRKRCAGGRPRTPRTRCARRAKR